MASKATVAAKFYECPLQDWVELIEGNECNAWVLGADAHQMWPRNRGLREYVQGLFIQAQNQALSDQQACIDGHFESVPEPEPGLSVSINEKLIGGGAAGSTAQRHPVSASLTVGFGQPFGCPLLDWRMFHRLNLVANLIPHTAVIGGEQNTSYTPQTAITIYEPTAELGAYVLPGSMINGINDFAYAAGGTLHTQEAAEVYFVPVLDEARVGLVPDSRIDLSDVAATVGADLLSTGGHFGLRAKHALEFDSPLGLQHAGLITTGINSSATVSGSKLQVSWDNLSDVGAASEAFSYPTRMALPSGTYSWKWLLLGYDMDYRVKPTEEPWDSNVPYTNDLHWADFSAITGGSYNPGLTDGVIHNTKTISIINTDQPDAALLEVQAAEMIWRTLHLVTLRLYNPLPVSATLAVAFAGSLRYRKTLAAGAAHVVQLPLQFSMGEYTDESLPTQEVKLETLCYLMQASTGADGDVPDSEGLPSSSNFITLNSAGTKFNPTNQGKYPGPEMLYTPTGPNPAAYAEADTNVPTTQELPSTDAVLHVGCCHKVYERTATPPSGPPTTTYVYSSVTAAEFVAQWGTEHVVAMDDCRIRRVAGSPIPIDCVFLQTDAAAAGPLNTWLDDRINFSDYPYTDTFGVTYSIAEVSPPMILLAHGISLKRTHYTGSRSLSADGFELTVTT